MEGYGKYYEIHSRDVSSFDVSDAHRLPTVSAAAALEELERGGPAGFVPTGLPSLDRMLVGGPPEDAGAAISGGLVKGQLTEVWGPPGSGKTAIGIQAAANALADGQRVIWIDGFHPVSLPRVAAVAAASARFHGASSSPPRSDRRILDRFENYACPSVAHFVALVCRSVDVVASRPDASLLVIDSLSALIGHDYPRVPEPGPGSGGGGGGGPSSKGRTGASSRRARVLHYISSSLQKLAATRGLAVMILSQCASSVQSESRASLSPAIGSAPWEQRISSRLCLFKDWVWAGNRPLLVHFVGFQTLNGKPASSSDVVAFDVGADGVYEVPHDGSLPSIGQIGPSRKRKLSIFQISDSDKDSDSDRYGWNEKDDRAVGPSVAPGWQGSEDILLGPDIAEEVD